MSTSWYARIENNETGPHTSADLQLMATRGVLKPTDYIRNGVEERWTLAANVQGLAFAAPPVGRPHAIQVPSLPPQLHSVRVGGHTLVPTAYPITYYGVHAVSSVAKSGAKPTRIWPAFAVGGVLAIAAAMTALVVLTREEEHSIGSQVTVSDRPNRSYDFLRAVSDAEQRNVLAGERDLIRAADKCEAIFFELNSISTRDVDQRLVDWLGRYCDLLIDMKAAFRKYARRANTDYQTRLLFESLMRISQGDTFGPALEQLQGYDQEIAAMQLLIDQRLRLMGELSRLANQMKTDE